jgi:ribosomal protein L37AE/L43A
MNTLLTKVIPLSRHLKADRSQQILDTPAIESGMSSRHTCLCCSTVLLRHMRLGGLYWCCGCCHADMPA